MGIPIVLVAVELVIGKLRGVDARCVKQVQHNHGLLGHLVLELEQPVVVNGAEVTNSFTNEVVLECLDGPLGDVACCFVGLMNSQ